MMRDIDIRDARRFCSNKDFKVCVALRCDGHGRTLILACYIDLHRGTYFS